MSQGQATEHRSGGIGPHFSRDGLTLLNIYMRWGITHSELRKNLARLGVDLDPWPQELEVPEPPDLPPIPPVHEVELFPDEPEEA